MMIGIDHPHTHNVTMSRMLQYVGPRGLYLLFLSSQGSHMVLVGMVIGIDHPHTQNIKYVPYVEGCGPKGLIFKYKGPAFS